MKILALPQDCFRLMLRPVVRFFLRNSLSFQDFSILAKSVFVDVAREEIATQADEVHVSKIVACTGIHRNEVNRILEDNKSGEDPAGSLGLVGRILNRCAL